MKKKLKIHKGKIIEEKEVNYIPININKYAMIGTSIEITPKMLKTNLLNRLFRAIVRIFAFML